MKRNLDKPAGKINAVTIVDETIFGIGLVINLGCGKIHH